MFYFGEINWCNFILIDLILFIMIDLGLVVYIKFFHKKKEGKTTDQIRLQRSGECSESVIN